MNRIAIWYNEEVAYKLFLTWNWWVSSKPSGNSVQLISRCWERDSARCRAFITTTIYHMEMNIVRSIETCMLKMIFVPEQFRIQEENESMCINWAGVHGATRCSVSPRPLRCHTLFQHRVRFVFIDSAVYFMMIYAWMAHQMNRFTSHRTLIAI